MVNDSDPEFAEKVLIGIGLPLLSLTVKVTVGFCPALPFATLTRVKLMPGTPGAYAGIVWPPMMEASNGSSPCLMWQVAHWLSSGCGPPAWLAPVVKLSASWQAPQAAAPGLLYQLLAWVAPVVDS